MKYGYYTKPEIVKCIKKVIAEEHDMKPTDISIDFKTRWQICRFPTGLIEKCALITIKTKGFEPAHRTLSQKQHQKWYIN